MVELEEVGKLADAIHNVGGINGYAVARNVLGSPEASYLDLWAHVYRCTQMAPEKVRPVLETAGIMDPAR